MKKEEPCTLSYSERITLFCDNLQLTKDQIDHKDKVNIIDCALEDFSRMDIVSPFIGCKEVSLCGQGITQIEVKLKIGFRQINYLAKALASRQ